MATLHRGCDCVRVFRRETISRLIDGCLINDATCMRSRSDRNSPNLPRYRRAVHNLIRVGITYCAEIRRDQSRGARGRMRRDVACVSKPHTCLSVYADIEK